MPAAAAAPVTATADTESVDYHGGDQPKYRALSKSIREFFTALVTAQTVYAFTVRQMVIGEGEEPFPFDLSQQQLVSHLTMLFLVRLAGYDRSRAGFIRSRGSLLQKQLLSSYGVGVNRAAQQMRQHPTLFAGMNEAQTSSLLGKAFDRLSEAGKLRLEDLPAQVVQLLRGASESALTRLEAQGEFRTYMQALTQTHLQRIARTEALYGSSAGQRDQLQAYGVEKVLWVIGPEACPLCQEYEGREIDIDDAENQPPLHPNCACSLEPVTNE